MKYRETKNKINKIWVRTKNNTNDLDGKVNRITPTKYIKPHSIVVILDSIYSTIESQAIGENLNDSFPPNL